MLCLINPTLPSKLVFRRSCQSAWSDLRLSPVFGCICPNSLHQDECHQIFKTVNGNPCIGKPSLFCHPLWTPLEQELMARLGRSKAWFSYLWGSASEIIFLMLPQSSFLSRLNSASKYVHAKHLLKDYIVLGLVSKLEHFCLGYYGQDQ